MQKSVLFIFDSFPAPEFRRLWQKAVSLRQEGYKVMVICPLEKKNKKKPKEEMEEIDGIKVFFYKKLFRRESVFSFLLGRFFDFIKIGRIVFSLLWKEKISFIHIVNPSDLPTSFGFFLQKLGKKFIYESNSDSVARLFLDYGNEWQVRLIGYFLRKRVLKALKRADLIIVPDLQEKKRVISLIPKMRHKIYTIEPLPDLRDFYRPFLGRDYKLGFKYLALFAGSLRKERGVFKLLQALEIIIKQFRRKDILFVLAGEGKDKEELKKMVKVKEIAENFLFPGWLSQEKFLAYLNAMDLGLIVSGEAGQSPFLEDVLFEYLAVGKPVVSFNLKLGRMRAEEAGSFVSGEDIFLFAKEIIKVIDNRERAKIMGEIGKERTEKQFNWIRSEIKLLSAYALCTKSH